jgi:RHS repeat-associated protein
LTVQAGLQKPRFKLRHYPDGTTQSWLYNTDGRLNIETLPNGKTWTMVYTDSSRTVTGNYNGNDSGTNPSVVTVRDPRANVISSTDVDGNTTTTTYDGLNRPLVVTGPSGTGSATQTWTHAYYFANLTETVTDASTSNVTTTMRDGLGRPANVTLANGSSTARSTTYTYAPNFQSVTITEGSGSNILIHTVYTDEAGHPILTTYPDGNHTIQNYDGNGNLISSQDEAGRVTSYTYDGLNRVSTVTQPDGAVEKLGYDPGGHLNSRIMPGGLTWSGNYSSASQLSNETLASGNATNRTIMYSYYGGSVGNGAGLLETANHSTEGTSISYAYSAFDRPTTVTFSGFAGNGTLPAIQGLTRSLVYDNRGNVKSAADAYMNTTFGNVTVTRAYDGYSQLLSDQVMVSGNVVSNLTQTWDAVGRRTALTDSVAGNIFAYTYDAAGQMVGAAEKVFNTFSDTYAYSQSGLLLSRNGTWGNVTSTFDTRGRPLGVTRMVGNATVLTENLTWNGDSRLASYGVVRSGSGGNETRAYGYDAQGRLGNETFSPPGDSATTAYTFDPANLGVRITANTTGTPTGQWAIPNGYLDGLGQALREELGGLTLTANGTTNGQGVDTPALNATLDTNPSTGPVVLQGLAFNTTSGNWTVPLNLSAGNFTLTVNAIHPSGQFVATAVSNFTIAANSTYAGQQVSNTFDGDGYVAARATLGGSTDTQTWDAAGRLLKLARRDGSNNGLDEASVYDPLGRRIQVTVSPVTAGNETGNETTTSYFDPSAAYLEVAAAQAGNVTWKMYGPDASGSFGGLQGVGGLEMTLDVAGNLAAVVVGDAQGHVTAYSAPAATSGPPGNVTWNVFSSGYGPLPGQTVLRWSQTGAANTTATFAAALTWQGRRIDASGYYWLGARIYDPVGGKFIAPDPLGQASSWDLYSYAGGDPINHADPTGMVTNQLYTNLQAAAGGFQDALASVATDPNEFLERDAQADPNPLHYIDPLGDEAAAHQEDIALTAANNLLSDAIGGLGSTPVGLYDQEDYNRDQEAMKSLGTQAAIAIGTAGFGYVAEGAVAVAEGATAMAEAAEATVPVGAAGSPSAVWSMNPFQRGQALEKIYGQNLPPNFPTFDVWDQSTGAATSIKSLDLNAASYQDPSRLTSTLNGYVNSASRYSRTTAPWAGATVNSNQIAVRQVQIIIPNSGTAAQQAAMQGAQQQALNLKNSVQLIFTVHP